MYLSAMYIYVLILSYFFLGKLRLIEHFQIIILLHLTVKRHHSSWELFETNYK